MISRDSTLVDVAFTVCTTLSAEGLKVVLVGGSAATYYAPSAYQSYDADFVALFATDRESEARLIGLMNGLGYDLDGNTFGHRHGNPFVVEFPKGPLQIGLDYVHTYDTVQRGVETLNVITATDSVRDRLAAYYFWDDRSSLQAAVAIARAVPDKVRLAAVEEWSVREGAAGKHSDFVHLLSRSRDVASN